MPKPVPEPIEPADVARVARELVGHARVAMLATVDGEQARVRPVSPVRIDGFTVYVANLRRYGKTAEIARAPAVELCFMSDGHDHVRITAIAEVLEDPVLLAEIWAANNLLRHYLGSPDNPELVIYRMRPTRVRFMREWALDYHEVALD
ncbi:MAG: pyridoxamine 5'-phosphate oxidase family protein [Chromatiales bacterium]|nr:pyridoxamine 5'-phosphate oxidase family protein [Chromatiales bacterium]